MGLFWRELIFGEVFQMGLGVHNKNSLKYLENSLSWEGLLSEGYLYLKFGGGGGGYFQRS